ncbi:MAG: two-component system OmpR family alkaline phosphatase synthesis response regulator [Planctomycetota bacterium]|nr:MAG: two-component system OmpR family alkaline phosphatase synthesis response regulator [Planctomycetota bacterium]
MPQTILVVEDEADILRGLRDNLAYEGWRVLTAGDGEKGLALAMKEKPDLVILDWMLPGMDGLAVCRELRARGAQVPVVFLTARGQEVDRVLGLEMGADDYVTKPFSVRELVARVKAILRRAAGTAARPAKFAIGDLEVDADAFTAKRGKKNIDLGRYEAEILRLLAQRRGQVVSRNDILNEVWGVDAYPTDRTVDNYIVKLRQKIEKDPKNPKLLITVHGAGYKVVEPA